MLKNCPVVVPDGDMPSGQPGERLPARLEYFNVVVLSQSCDVTIQRNGLRKVDLAVVSPVWTVTKLREVHPEYGSQSFLSDVIAGRRPTWYALAPCLLPGFEVEHQFIELRRVLSIPVAWAEALAAQQSPRLRLLSPWREHMSKAVGEFFSRVAIPQPIPRLPRD